MHEQYRNRTSGDNGLSKNYNIINGGLDLWIQKLTSQLLSESSGKNKVKLNDSDWQAFLHSFDDWQEAIQQALKSIGWPLRHATDLGSQSALSEENPTIMLVYLFCPLLYRSIDLFILL